MMDVEDGTAFSFSHGCDRPEAQAWRAERHRLGAQRGTALLQSFESPCCQVPSLRVSVAGVTWCSDRTSATAEI